MELIKYQQLQKHQYSVTNYSFLKN